MDATPPPSPLPITNEFKCTVCEKQFKSKRGLSRHKSIVRKYNETPEQEKIPDFLTDKFSLSYTSAFKQKFKKCWLTSCFYGLPQKFRGSTGYQELASILKNANWGVKHYLQGQQTYVQLSSHNQLREENPLIKLRKQRAALMNIHSRKPRYSYGEVTVEWRQKKDTDAEGNVCEGGFMIFHFFVSKKMFCS
ncbi:hypothetical protein RhiirA4_484870 [Rhizophagus irregularis]|uniref:C2H2-type domain-containing protein n=1 Tax=Rhizophagus irregularis TaxID=588596 RepID=A0A2I1HPF7_9GLOM|nr:hypothetical protein RhiirA4_484870 [Rhizophagus irregularis]